MSKEAMKLALEALVYASSYCDTYDAITALREALAEPQEKYQYGTPLLDAMTGKANEALDKKAKPDFWEGYVPEPVKPAQQEPVAVWELQEDGWDTICDGDWLQTLPVGTKLYTTPPAQRKPLTDEQLEAMAEKYVTNCYFDTLKFARAIEAAHGIKGDA